MSTIVQAPDPFALQFIETYRLYRVAVYSNLFNGIVYGEGQQTRPISKFFLTHCALNIITGAYIVAYVTSVYVLL